MPTPRLCLAPLLLLVAAGALAGCGPSLHFQLKQERHFEATRACGQGPFEIEVAPLEARLGERYQLHVCSPRPLVGRYEVRAVDGVRLASGDFSRSFVRGYDQERGEALVTSIARPDNERCLGEPAVPVGVVEPSWPSSPPGGWLPDEGEPPPPSARPPHDAFEEEPPVFEAPPLPVGEVHAPAHLVEIPARELSCRTHALGFIDIWSQEHRVRRSDGKSGAPEEPFSILLWSEEPNDLEGATFVLTQYAATSSEGGDEGYLAHLREREGKERASAQEDARRRQERSAHCADNTGDILCWGLGGKAAHDSRQSAEQKRREQRMRRNDELTRRQAEAEARWGRLETPVARTPLCGEPSGPPPPAPDELTPPRPTMRSEWVPGHYLFACNEWVWSSGFWRVPDQDLVEERWLITAPSAPPLPPVEAPPALVVVEGSLVWIPGVWIYVDGRYVWAPGSFRERPHPDARWRPGEWRSDGGRVRFVPGRWE